MSEAVSARQIGRSARAPRTAGNERVQAPVGTGHGGKYETSGSELLRSSAGTTWPGSVSAELRRHTDLHCPSFLQPVNEVAIAIAGTATVRRRADGPEQNFGLQPGAACICPQGVEVGYLHIAGGQVDMLHLYLPRDLYGNLSSTLSCPYSALIYCGGLDDPLLKQIGATLAAELQADGAPEGLLIDSLGLALSAWILKRYSRPSGTALTNDHRDAVAGRGLDDARLRRVLDFMASNLERDLSLADLADVACLSLFHFSRAFKRSTGHAPYQYMSDLRIDRCKTLLATSRRSIDDIASATGFSSGANLSRAFRKSVGQSPSQYRGQGG